MAEKNWTNEELIELWLIATDDEATDEQRETLNRLIVENPQVRKQFIALAQQQAWLMWHGSCIDSNENNDAYISALALFLKDYVEKPDSNQSIAPTLPQNQPPLGETSAQPSGGWWSHLSPPFITFCVGVLLTTGVVILLARSGVFLSTKPIEEKNSIANSNQLNSSRLSSGIPVAVLSSNESCNWGNDSWKVGHNIPLGNTITLHEGIAEFRLGNELSRTIAINVEGPASLVFTSPTSLVLRYGKLTADVPWATSDFTLLVGTCNITSRGAQLGVNVDGNSIDVHTFSGAVSVNCSPFAHEFDEINEQGLDLDDDSEELQNVTPVIVNEGKACMFLNGKHGIEPPQEHAADRKIFATNVSMNDHLVVTQKYVDAIKKLRPISYWRFESLDNDFVRNEIEDAPKLSVKDGKITLSGDANNKYANFGPQVSNGYFWSDSEIPSLSEAKEYSIEFWLKPSHFHLGSLVSFVTWPTASPEDVYGKLSLVLELQRPYDNRPRASPNTIRFTHRNPPGHSGGKTCYSNRLYFLRQWQHVVAVKSGALLQIFLNGERVAIEPNRSALSQGLHRIMVGQCYNDDRSSGRRDFVGQLDELVIYPFALNANEIEKHFKIIESGQQNKSNVSENPRRNTEL